MHRVKYSEIPGMIRLIREAAEDEKDDKKPEKKKEEPKDKEDKKKADTKEKEPETAWAPKKQAPIEKPKKEKPPAKKDDWDPNDDPWAGMEDDEPIQRTGAPSVDSFKGATFNAPNAPAPEGFDFDKAFNDALKMGKQARNNAGAPEPGIGDDTDTTKKLQPNALATRQQQGLQAGGGKHFASPKAEAMDILMNEIYMPGMQIGQRLLPALFTELGRLNNQDPQAFKKAFAAALANIREVENAWFAGILGKSPEKKAQAPSGNPTEKAILDRIMYAMDKYFTAVFKNAAKNAHNLVARLEDMKKRLGQEAFNKAFLEALSETRDLEDKMFAQHMGGMRGLPPPRR